MVEDEHRVGEVPGERNGGGGRSGGPLRKRGDESRLGLADGPLGGRIKLAEGNDAVAAEFDPDRIFLPGGEDIDDSAPIGVLPAEGDQILARIPERGQPLDHPVPAALGVLVQAEKKLREAFRSRKRPQEPEKIGHGQGRRAIQQIIKIAHPGGRRLQGRGGVRGGILRERGKAPDGFRRAEVLEEKTGLILEAGQRTGGRTDEDNPARPSQGQLDEKVGDGRLRQAGNRKTRPVLFSEKKGYPRGFRWAETAHEVRIRRLL